MSMLAALSIAHDATPKVFNRGGVVFANSRDVAEFFSKRHDDVLRAIDKLLSHEPDLRHRNFTETREDSEMPAGGTRSVRAINMDRDAFVLLVMGFTGPQALKFKRRYIQAYNDMEAALRSTRGTPEQLLSDPTALRHALLQYSERVIEAEKRLAELAPQAAALARLSASEGSMSITDAAKVLQIQPKRLFEFLRAHGWTYRRAGGVHDVAYQAKLDSGLLETKISTVRRPGHTERAYDQCRITPKGIAKLSRLLTVNSDQSRGEDR